MPAILHQSMIQSHKKYPTTSTY